MRKIFIAFGLLVFAGFGRASYDPAVAFMRFVQAQDWDAAYEFFSPAVKETHSRIKFQFDMKERFPRPVMRIEEVILEQEELRPLDITLPKLNPFRGLRPSHKRRIFELYFSDSEKVLYGVDVEKIDKRWFVREFLPLPNLEKLLAEPSHKIGVKKRKKIA